MLVQIHLAGGMDAILTTNPKTRAELAADVDRPYEDADITEVGATRIGPLFRPLLRHVPKMAILNGVDAATVSHETGRQQLFGMRRFPVTQTAAGFHAILAKARQVDTPLWDARFVSNRERLVYSSGRSLVLFPSDEQPNDGVLDALSRLAQDPERKGVILDRLSAELRRCNADQDCAPIDTVRALLARMPTTPLPKPDPIVADDTLGEVVPSVRPLVQGWATTWRNVLFLMKHRLAASVSVECAEAWDTHAFNDDRQRWRMQSFAPALSYFLDQLAVQKTSDGVPLSEEVGVLISSELGRYPVKNARGGKDHLPEFPAIFIGPGIRPGQYGNTDRYLMSDTIRWGTGLATGGGHSAAPCLDDLGATVLHWFGVRDTAPLGYWGRPFEFLFT